MQKLKHPRKLEDGEKVKVYRNLHSNGLLSVKAKSPNGTFTVAERLPAIFLKDVTFEINQKIRNRILKTRRKEVHAYVVGECVSGDFKLVNEKDWRRIRYNPYDSGDVAAFRYNDDGSPVKHLDSIYM